MSVSSLARSKDRGPKSTLRPVKLATPKLEKKTLILTLDDHKNSTKKENPKPNIRVLSRIERSVMDPPRIRKSTTSLPKGTSPGPSDFSRMLSDLRKKQAPSDGSNNAFLAGSSGSRVSERSVQKKRVCKNLVMGSKMESKSEGNVKGFRGFEKLGECSWSGLESDMKAQRSVRIGRGNLGEVKVPRNVCDFDLGTKDLNVKSKIVNGIREKEDARVDVNKMNPSKLRQKLAFLEGKVKRIASDIKRTKEMLDMNNPDASKVVLSDIQEKIFGIEKAMGNVTIHPYDTKYSVEIEANSQSNKLERVKNSTIGMNTVELEARLFPHQNARRNGPSLKVPSVLKNHHYVSIPSGFKESSVIDKNPIAMEFLASLKNEQSKIGTRDSSNVLDFSAVQEMDGGDVASKVHDSPKMSEKDAIDQLITNETIGELDKQSQQDMMIDMEPEGTQTCQLNEIGRKASTGGWFVSERELILLAHDDASCSLYDIANCEGKGEYKPPFGGSPNIWRDCWIIRATGADGCSGRYVVAASAGNTMESGFCSWDFYTKDVRAFHIEDMMKTNTSNSRTALTPIPNIPVYRGNSSSALFSHENQQWWYSPCGPLIVSTASCQKAVRMFDIRDGEQVMKWDMQKHVLAMEFSSPLQWKNRGKVVIAEGEAISLFDVNSISPLALQSVSSCGMRITSMHVNNTDAELGGGVRQRLNSSESEGNDGVFCTPDSINIMDFRKPSGVAIKIPKQGVNAQSVYSRGDSIFIGCANTRPGGKDHLGSQIQHFSLSKQRMVKVYALPNSNAHSDYAAITQVWGNSDRVMAVCGLGLHVFDSVKDDGFQSFRSNYGDEQNISEVIGPDDLYFPSFDYSSSRVLVISRDRPALWRHLH